MSKYRRLKDYLYQCDEGIKRLTFSEVEKIVGFELPCSAYLYRAWWANSSHNGLRVWVPIGWYVSTVDFDSKYVEFERRTNFVSENEINIIDANTALDLLHKLHELSQLNVIDEKTYRLKREILLDKIE